MQYCYTLNRNSQVVRGGGMAMLILMIELVRPSVGFERHLYIVAHQDDAILFMNPAIQQAIDQKHAVRTMYLTAGDACKGKAYWQRREAGTKAAYAAMARVDDVWTPVTRNQSAAMYALAANLHVSLVFFRLPGGMCYKNSTSLRRLWLEQIPRLTTVEGSHSYTKDTLTQALLEELHDFLPDMVGMMDSTAQAPVGTDPYASKVHSPTCRTTGASDHHDHIATAMFSQAARTMYTHAHRVVVYRGYNIVSEPANLSPQDSSRKREIFLTYMRHDPTLSVPLECLYEEWILRQYTIQAESAKFEGEEPTEATD